MKINKLYLNYRSNGASDSEDAMKGTEKQIITKTGEKITLTFEICKGDNFYKRVLEVLFDGKIENITGRDSKAYQTFALQSGKNQTQSQLDFYKEYLLDSNRIKRTSYVEFGNKNNGFNFICKTEKSLQKAFTDYLNYFKAVETQVEVVEVVETQVETLTFPTIQSFLESTKTIEETGNGDLVIHTNSRIFLTTDKEFCSKYLASKMFGDGDKATSKQVVKLNIADSSYEVVELVIESEPEPELKTTYTTSAEYFDIVEKREVYEREGVIWNKKENKDEHPAFFVDYLKDGRVHCARPYNSNWNPVCDYITMQYGKRYEIVGRVYMNIGASLNSQYLVLKEEL